MHISQHHKELQTPPKRSLKLPSLENKSTAYISIPLPISQNAVHDSILRGSLVKPKVLNGRTGIPQPRSRSKLLPLDYDKYSALKSIPTNNVHPENSEVIRLPAVHRSEEHSMPIDLEVVTSRLLPARNIHSNKPENILNDDDESYESTKAQPSHHTERKILMSNKIIQTNQEFNKAEFKDEKQEECWISEVVDTFLEDLRKNILTERPENLSEFIIMHCVNISKGVELPKTIAKATEHLHEESSENKLKIQKRRRQSLIVPF